MSEPHSYFEHAKALMYAAVPLPPGEDNIVAHAEAYEMPVSPGARVNCESDAWTKVGAVGGHIPFQDAQHEAVNRILAERRRQFTKWGEQNHDLPVWMEILHEETGELCEANLHEMFGGPKRNNVFNEAVQVAAVACQIVEYLIRRNRASQQQSAEPKP